MTRSCERGQGSSQNSGDDWGGSYPAEERRGEGNGRSADGSKKGLDMDINIQHGYLYKYV